MSNNRHKALLSWSSGKDAAWSLHCIQQNDEYEVLGLVTSVNQAAHRVAMHGVRQDILKQQALATGIELYVVELPSPCNNKEYEQRMTTCLTELIADLGVTHIIFGDLFLEDIRQYREKQMRQIGLEAVFPLWGQTTSTVAQEMISGGLEASISCVDKTQISEGFSGRKFDRRLLQDLPDGVDPCGENGEFHTLVTNGPMFKHEVVVERGPLKVDPRFVYTDFLTTRPDFIN